MPTAATGPDQEEINDFKQELEDLPTIEPDRAVPSSFKRNKHDETIKGIVNVKVQPDGVKPSKDDSLAKLGGASNLKAIQRPAGSMRGVIRAAGPKSSIEKTPSTVESITEEPSLENIAVQESSPEPAAPTPASTNQEEEQETQVIKQPVYDAPKADETKTATNPDDLRTAEEEPDDFSDDGEVEVPDHERVGAGYVKGKNKPGFIRKQLGKRNRLYLIGGGGMLAAATIGIFIFITLAPLKIMHIVNNLQNRFYATSESAVSNEADVLFSDYLKKYVLPAARNCPGAVTKNCNPIKDGGLVSQLYKGWRNARLEDKLSGDYGIEFKASKGHLYMKMRGLTGNGVNIDGFSHDKTGETLSDFIDKSNDPQWKKVSRSELRQSYKDALSSETKLKQMFYRYKVASLLSKKYGLKRCIVACEKKG